MDKQKIYEETVLDAVIYFIKNKQYKEVEKLIDVYNKNRENPPPSYLATRQNMENLRKRVVLSEVVAEYLTVQEHQFHTADCPFCEDYDGSLVIMDESGKMECGNCGYHSDALQFLMSHERMRFTDAFIKLNEMFPEEKDEE